MTLTVKQKTNIRHFIYYLVNGTLNFKLIQTTFGDEYHEILKSNPDLFYKTICFYINKEIRINPIQPDTQKLGKLICQLYEDNLDNNDIGDWEADFTCCKLDYSSDFKEFTKWFIESKTVFGVTYRNYIEDGASFVEQCFAIWTNVINLENKKVINNEHAIKRVEEYIKSYYIPGYVDNLEGWECELH